MTTKTCPVSGQTFTITAEDKVFYQKLGLPEPTLSPMERQRRRLSWRNERSLYRRKCDGTSKVIISMYPQDAPFPVYAQSHWWSDSWDALSFGRELDFSQPFFPQFKALKNTVPHSSLYNTNNENSEYVNLTGYSKDCYLLFASEYSDECLYGSRVIKCNNCLDCYDVSDSQYCYESSFLENCYEVFFSQHVKNSSESYFLSDCQSCRDCLFCTNLKNAQYCVMNQQYSKEEFLTQKAKLFEKLANGEVDSLYQTFQNFLLSQPHRANRQLNCEDCTGDQLQNSKNCHHCFEVIKGEACRYVAAGHDAQHVVDASHTTEGQWGYEVVSYGYKSQNGYFVNGMWSSHDCAYSENLHSCHDCFGCIGLRQKSYCIFNTQYSKEDYEILREKIIAHMKTTGEWGEFFPIADSPFGYNETIAQEYYPLTPEQIAARGYTYREPLDSVQYDGPEVDVPSDIANVNDDICEQILTCTATGKHYRIMHSELNFYRKMKLPIPRICPDERHQRRVRLRNPRALFDRQCNQCQTDVQSSFAPERPEKIVCANCYLKITT